jgi:chromosome partitioning protein
MDCGPSLGVLTINALATADEVFIPLQPHFLALHGLSKLLETTALVARRINPQLVVTGVVVCLYDATTKLAQEVVADLHTFLSRSRGSSVPWASAKVFNTKIRRNIKLAECPSFGQNIFAYAPKSTGAADYAALAMEVMGDSSPLRVETARLKVETPVPVVSRQTTVQPVV